MASYTGVTPTTGRPSSSSSGRPFVMGREGEREREREIQQAPNKKLII
jgi:hypothetical protein